MNTYYGVTTSFDDRGHVIALLSSVIEAEQRPENTFTEARRKDIYVDWFDNEQSAIEFIEEARSA